MKWIPIKKKYKIPLAVQQAVQKLKDAGFEALLVGGSVRDFLLGREPKDHDVATNATPDQVLELFPNAIEVGKAFGVIKVPIKILKNDLKILEIATFRKDLPYLDYRHPTGVEFSSPEEDARRRDFTVNALFYDPQKKIILDYVEGLKDLKKKCLKAIGNPEKRFEEDALRLIRAIRLSCVLEFKIDSSTQKAIRAKTHLIGKVSGERVRDELELIFKSGKSIQGMRLLQKYGLLFSDPKIKWNRLKLIKKTGPIDLFWSAVALEAHWDKTHLEKFHLSTDVIKAIIETKEIVYFLEHESDKTSEGKLKKKMLSSQFKKSLLLSSKNFRGRSRVLKFQSEMPKKFNAFIQGSDLLKMGLIPGPQYKKILDQVIELQLERKLKSKKQALYFVKGLIDSRFSTSST